MLNRFNPQYFYTVYYDGLALDAPYLRLSGEAIQLMARYYAAKYTLSFSFHRNFVDFDKVIEHFLEKNKNRQNFRHTFYIGVSGSHAMCINYLNENNEEGFLCADSLGSQIGRVIHHNNTIETEGSSKIAADILKSVTALPVYIVSSQRLADFYSCDADTFVFSRDCCGKIKGEYLVPNLLQALKSSAVQREGYMEVKLKNIFLKLAQIPAYTRAHMTEEKELIHSHKGREETLADFNARYGEDQRENKRPLPSYLRVKKIKMANTIEIQFYMEQLERLLKDKWTPELKKAFYSAAKMELSRQWSITINRARKGLYGFAYAFLSIGDIPKDALERSASSADNKHSVDLPEEFLEFAKLLIKIVSDPLYWKGKTFFGFGEAEGISLMQEKLKNLGEGASLEAQFNALRLIAYQQLSKKNIFYLFTSISIEDRDPMVKSCFSVFIEDLRNSPSFAALRSDWDKFQLNSTLPKKDQEPLPSMERYKVPRVHF